MLLVGMAGEGEGGGVGGLYQGTSRAAVIWHMDSMSRLELHQPWLIATACALASAWLSASAMAADDCAASAGSAPSSESAPGDEVGSEAASALPPSSSSPAGLSSLLPLPSGHQPEANPRLWACPLPCQAVEGSRAAPPGMAAWQARDSRGAPSAGCDGLEAAPHPAMPAAQRQPAHCQLHCLI